MNLFERKNRRDPGKLSRFSVDVDKYDREDFENIMKQMEDFSIYRERLVQSSAGELGYDVYQDLYSSLWKVEPKLLEQSAIRPSHIVNRAIMSEMYNLGDFAELRNWCQGDDIGSALACNSLEPNLEELYDSLADQVAMAKELDQTLNQLASSEKDKEDLDKMYNDWVTNQSGDEQEATDWNEKLQQQNQVVEQLQELAQKQSEELEQSLDSSKSIIKQSLKDSLKKTKDEVSNTNVMAEACGMEPGSLQRLPAHERIEFARKMQNQKFARISELFGPMKRLAFSEQRRKVNYAPDEVYDIELGNNLERVLLSEKMQLRHPKLKWLFMKDLLESKLTQYKMRGSERAGKGGIIYCEDGSGSMHGDREIWAKAVGLCLLNIAKKQKRPFYAIHFGSENEIYCMDFSNNDETNRISADRVVEFAELFWGGGTDFVTPLNRSLELLNSEFNKTGAVKADIVFATDGMCGVPDEFMKRFKEEQKKLGFKMWGINIGGNVGDQPLSELADGRVASIHSLINGENIRDIFNAL